MIVAVVARESKPEEDENKLDASGARSCRGSTGITTNRPLGSSVTVYDPESRLCSVACTPVVHIVGQSMFRKESLLHILHRTMNVLKTGKLISRGIALP